MIMHWIAATLLTLRVVYGPAGNQPTPTPTIAPAPMIEMAGDPGPTIQDTRSTPSALVPAVPVPSAARSPSLVPATEPAWEAGPIELVVRVCVDANGDQRCTLGEGVAGVPVVVVDATTGAELQHGHTAADGRSMLRVQLEQRTSLTVDVPYLAFSHAAYSGQGGVSLVLPAPTLPKELP